jgi:hypothetical protein
MGIAVSRAGIAVLISLLAQPASADFWKDINPLRPITPNWGPLIPRPKTPGEVLPPCWGSPQTCRPDHPSMRGDQPRYQPYQQPVVRTSANAVCVCLERDGRLVAWFNYRPSGYGSAPRLHVSAQGCDGFIQCNYQYYTRFNSSIRTIGWSYRQNTLNGHTIYLLTGLKE